MDSQTDRSVRFLVTKEPFRQTTSADLTIKFNLYFNIQNSYYTINQDSRMPLPLLFSSCYYAPALVVVRQHLSYDDIQEAVGKAIGTHLRDDERSHAIRLACEEVRKAFPTKTLTYHVELIADLNIWIRYFYVSVVEVGSVRTEERCCICLEEPGTMALPCSHVFHGGCVMEWIQKSHYCCPLCRYEMPGYK